MSKKPVIALLANFPLHIVDKGYVQRGWHTATWLSAMYDMLQNLDLYEIHWITFRQGSFFSRHFEKNGQHFHVLPAYSLLWAQRTRFVHARMSALWLLRKIKPDLLHVWGSEGRYSVSGMGYKGKKLLSVQGNLTAYAERAPMPPFMVRQAVWERRAFSRFDFFTGESPWSVERIKEMTSDKKVFCWDYCVESRFFQAERKPALHPTCLIACTSSKIKNVDIAIQAFSSPELSHVELILAGVSPTQYTNLPGNIKALGGVSRDEMVRLLSETWCLVHPSLAETGPTVVKEARVMGVPVVISDECGSMQYVEDGKSGFIIKPKDVEALIQSVSAVTKDRRTAEQMGLYGREECRTLLSRETMLKGLCSMYEQLLAE